MINKVMEGYIYCFVNESMPGICKIGMTERTPVDRLKEANCAGTWRPPTPYTCVYAERVNNALKVERLVHKELGEQGKRISLKSEFFKTDVNEVKRIVESVLARNNMSEESTERDESRKERKKVTKSYAQWYEQHLEDGQEIRHIIGETKIWKGIYCKRSGNVISEDGGRYRTIGSFCVSHLRSELPYKEFNTMTNWKLCEVKTKEGNWTSMARLRKVANIA